jgi:hypothetical protein
MQLHHLQIKGKQQNIILQIKESDGIQLAILVNIASPEQSS